MSRDLRALRWGLISGLASVLLTACVTSAQCSWDGYRWVCGAEGTGQPK